MSVRINALTHMQKCANMYSMSETRIAGTIPTTLHAELKRVLTLKGATIDRFVYAAVADIIENSDVWHVNAEGVIERGAKS